MIPQNCPSVSSMTIHDRWIQQIFSLPYSPMNTVMYKSTNRFVYLQISKLE
jgi:hypothetical protein